LDISRAAEIVAKRPDFSAIAGAFGIAAERVSTLDAYVSAVRKAISRRRPFLLEVDLDSIGPMTVAYTGTSRPPVSGT
jgi:thiamine pyrophosphate-dependent acetolactate synthase large subunit-like protein